MTDDDDRQRVSVTTAMYPTSERKPVEEFTTNELLRSIGGEVQRMRLAMYVVAGVGVLQLVLLALWIFGVFTVEFKPVSSSPFGN